MSRLEELINQYCPDGVEYRTIEDCTIKTENIKWKTTNGFFQYIDLSSVDRNTHSITETTVIEKATAPSRAQQIIRTDDVIFGTTRPMLKRFCSIPQEYDNQIASTGFCVLRANSDLVLPRWLFHVVSSSDFYQYIQPLQVEGNYPSISNGNVKSYEMPVPPLPVQEEIVRILDKMTELETELETELDFRKKQYEYYRDKVLRFEDRDDVEWKPLKDIATNWFRGNGIKREEVTADGKPCVRYGEIYTTYGLHFNSCVSHTSDTVVNNPKIAKKGAILFAITGESVEDIATSTAYLGDEEIYVGGDILVMEHKQDAKYIAYALSTTDARQQKSKGRIKSKVVHHNKNDISNIIIPVPKDIAEQSYIADLLDRFYDLINDMNSGIPVEIGFRHQQYEYYRDKLLTFKRLEVS